MTRYTIVISTDAFIPNARLVRDWTYKKTLEPYYQRIFAIIESENKGKLLDFDYNTYAFHKTRLRGIVETDEKTLEKIARSVIGLDESLKFHIIKKSVSFDQLDPYMYDPHDLNEISEMSFP